MNKTIIELFDYVNSASDLAEYLRADLKKGLTISNETILALDKFIKAAQAIKPLKNELNKAIIKNN